MTRELNSLVPRLPIKMVARYAYGGEWKMRETEMGPYFYPASDGASDGHADNRPEDGWSADMDHVRNEFMKIQTIQDVLLFYRRTRFGIEMYFDEIPQYQQMFKILGNTPYSKWPKLKLTQNFGEDDIEDLMGEPSLTLRWLKGRPFLECDVLQLEPHSELLRCFAVLFQFEQLCGMKQGICELDGCHEPLPAFCRCDKRFCNKNHANLQRYRDKHRVS